MIACDRCHRLAEIPEDWKPGSRLCRTCRAAWNMEQECPDGTPHELEFLSWGRCDQGPLEGGPYKICECKRCGTGSIGGPSFENVMAAIDWANQAKRESSRARSAISSSSSIAASSSV
jgi:hypothetical protein